MTSSSDIKSKVKDNSSRKTPLGIERRFDRFGEWLDTSWAAKVISPMLDKHPHSILILTWLMRIVVGLTFTVSGLAKAIDPWGTYYKMQEYLAAMHLPLEEWGNTVLTLSFFLFSLEFFIGVSLLTGCFRKATPILTALVMLVMLPLTLWIAVADPVADCGCFGDFLVISNWATFVKNVLLAIATVWLLKFNRRACCLITPYLQWMAAVGVAAFVIAVGLIGYREQPLLDFRQYKVGTQLLVADDMPEYEPVYEFVYEKDGVEKIFAEDDELPDADDGWKFVRREEKGFEKSDAGMESDSSVSDFRIWNEDASEDVTESLTGVEHQLILLTPDIKSLSMAASWKINRLYDMAENLGIDFFAVASGSPDEIEEWRDLSSGQYPIYTAQDTSIKELVRGNPGLVWLEDGKIVWKTALSAVLLSDDDQKIHESSDIYDSSDVSDSSDHSESADNSFYSFNTFPIGIWMTGPQTLTCLSIILIAFLSILSLAPYLRK